MRITAAAVLMGPQEPRVADRLAQMINTDPDSSVRRFVADLQGFAPAAYGTNAAAKRRLETPGLSQEEKAQLLSEVAGPSVPGGWNVAEEYLRNPSSSRPVREAAIHALGLAVFMSRGQPGPDPKRVLDAIAPFLDSSDASIRITAARELARIHLPSAKSVLEARKRIEVDARVLREIDTSIAAVQRRDSR